MDFLTLFVATLCLANVWAADTACINAGGTCQDESIACAGGYQSGLCSGAANRRCCMPGTSSSGDDKCRAASGTCKDNSLTMWCDGTYRSGLCSGSALRQCCIPYTTEPRLARTDCYGTIDDLHPTGKAQGGVEASKKDVDDRIDYLHRYKRCFQAFGYANCIEPALLAAIASRETQGGVLLDSNGRGKSDANGYGIMQCDVNQSGITCGACKPLTCCHLEMMSRFLISDKIALVKRSRLTWSPSQQLQGAVAAYNRFPASTNFAYVDYDPVSKKGTTGRDYSNDVIARAQWLKGNYKF